MFLWVKMTTDQQLMRRFWSSSENTEVSQTVPEHQTTVHEGKRDALTNPLGDTVHFSEVDVTKN